MYHFSCAPASYHHGHDRAEPVCRFAALVGIVSVEEIRERKRNPKSPNPKPEKKNGKKREGQEKKEENTAPLSSSEKTDVLIA